MIEARGLTKRFGSTVAVDEVTTVMQQKGQVGPWSAYAGFVAETLLVLVVGMVLVTRRDA